MILRPLILLSLIVPLGLPLSACAEFGPRVYTAHPYQAEETCIAASVPLGVVHADELASTCAPVCLVLDETLYVSVVCAPYPARAALVTPEDTADCALAIALLETEARCEDGLPQPSDAGIIEDAALDSPASGNIEDAASDSQAPAL